MLVTLSFATVKAKNGHCLPDRVVGNTIGQVVFYLLDYIESSSNDGSFSNATQVRQIKSLKLERGFSQKKLRVHIMWPCNV